MSPDDVESLTDEQQRQLHGLYQEAWWTKQRALADIPAMLRHTDYVFGVCEPGSARLLGFARVLTDRVFKAFIFDVIVARECRGRGLATRLLNRILDHSDLRAVRHIELACLPEMAPFYRRFGFSEEVGGLILMRRDGSSPDFSPQARVGRLGRRLSDDDTATGGEPVVPRDAIGVRALRWPPIG